MFFALNLLNYVFATLFYNYPDQIGKNYIFLEDIQDVVNVHGAYYQRDNKASQQIHILVAAFPGHQYHFTDLYITLKMCIKFSSTLTLHPDSEWEVYLGEKDLLLIRATFIASPLILLPAYSLYDHIWVKGDIYQGSPTYFLDSFDFHLWLAFLTIFVLCIIVIVLIKMIISRAVTSFDIISLILNQGVGQSSISSNLLSFKTVLFSLSLMLIVFHCGFGAFLSSRLLINKSRLPFNDFYSLLEQNEYMLCLRRDSAAYQIAAFEKRHNPNFKVQINGETCPNIFKTINLLEYVLDDPIKAACKHDKIVLMSSGKVKHFRLFSRQCGISPINGRYINQQSSLIVNPGFKYRELFNRALIRIRTSGVIKNMQLREMIAMNKEYGFDNPHHLENNVHTITFHHIHLILIVFVAIGFLSLLILLGEIVLKHSIL